MDLNTFIVAVFCLTDDWLKDQQRPRKRGPKPKLADSEVLTIEIVGEFLGIDTDKGLYLYFQRQRERPAATLSERREYLRSVAGLEVSESTSAGCFVAWDGPEKKSGGS